MKTAFRYHRGRILRKADDLFRRVLPSLWGARNSRRNTRRRKKQDRPARAFLGFMRRRHGDPVSVLGAFARQWKLGVPFRDWFVVYFPEKNRVKFMRKRSKPFENCDGRLVSWDVFHYDLISREANRNAIRFAEKIDP